MLGSRRGDRELSNGSCLIDEPGTFRRFIPSGEPGNFEKKVSFNFIYIFLAQ